MQLIGVDIDHDVLATYNLKVSSQKCLRRS